MKNDMNYEAIKTRIKTLAEAAERKPKGRIETILEPIREDLLEARGKGVRLRELYSVVKAESQDISPSSFAKYAQRHLQVKKQREKPSTPKQKHVEKTRELPLEGQPVNPVQPPQQKNETQIQDESEQPRTQAGKPRIARGNY